MWCRIFVSCSVLHSCQPEVKVWTSAQNTRKPSSPRNVSCLLGDPSYVVISLQAVLERLENLLFIINTLYWGLGRDKTEYSVIVKATVRINRDWSPYKWLPWRRSCRLGGMNSTITEVLFLNSKWKCIDQTKKASCLHRGLLNEQGHSSVLACEAGSLKQQHLQRMLIHTVSSTFEEDYRKSWDSGLILRADGSYLYIKVVHSNPFVQFRIK